MVYGMVGGGDGSLIGKLHRRGASLYEATNIEAGCFSQDYNNTLKIGNKIGISNDRLYRTYQEMIEKESDRSTRLDFVTIAVPNYLHYQIAKDFLNNGFNVLCEKPMTMNAAEAIELSNIVKRNKRCFCIAYTYTAYPMIKVFREIVKSGEIGNILSIHAEFTNDWLLRADKDQYYWRLDPAKSGISNCVADIGSHIESIVYFITGLETDKILAKLEYNQAVSRLDCHANILVRFLGGAVGNYLCSQITAGYENQIKIRVSGEKGSVAWGYTSPDQLSLSVIGRPTQMLYRENYCNNTDSAKDAGSVSFSYPGSSYEAFANLYEDFTKGIAANRNLDASIKRPYYPDEEMGVHCMRFIEACVTSSQNENVWIDF